MSARSWYCRQQREPPRRSVVEELDQQPVRPGREAQRYVLQVRAGLEPIILYQDALPIQKQLRAARAGRLQTQRDLARTRRFDRGFRIKHAILSAQVWRQHDVPVEELELLRLALIVSSREARILLGTPALLPIHIRMATEGPVHAPVRDHAGVTRDRGGVQPRGAIFRRGEQRGPQVR